MTILPSVLYCQRALLPEVSAIYFVADRQNTIVYVGRARNLRARWKRHTRRVQMEVDHRIYWIEVAECDLKHAEQHMIGRCHALWNYAPIGRQRFATPFRTTITELEVIAAAYIRDIRATEAAMREVKRIATGK